MHDMTAVSKQSPIIMGGTNVLGCSGPGALLGALLLALRLHLVVRRVQRQQHLAGRQGVHVFNERPTGV